MTPSEYKAMYLIRMGNYHRSNEDSLAEKKCRDLRKTVYESNNEDKKAGFDMAWKEFYENC